MEKKVVIIGQMDNTQDHTFESANRIYERKAACPTIPTCGGGGIQPKVIRKGNDMEQQVEDYLYTASDGEQYGIFKLTPRECGRLMGVKDSDIDKMFSVNSNSQCYKQFGNSIVVPVLMAIFSQLNIQGIKPWNEMTQEEKTQLVNKTRDWR